MKYEGGTNVSNIECKTEPERYGTCLIVLSPASGKLNADVRLHVLFREELAQNPGRVVREVNAASFESALGVLSMTARVGLDFDDLHVSPHRRQDMTLENREWL